MKFSAAVRFGIMAGMVSVLAASLLEAYGIDRAFETCAIAAVLTFIILMTIKLVS